MALEVHLPPTVGMQEFVARRMQFHVTVGMQFKMERMDGDWDVLPKPPALEGYVENAIPFKQERARKPKRRRGVA